MKRSRQSQVDSVRKKQFLESSKDDDIAIHRLEKLLKFKKRKGKSEKSKKLPAKFTEDGLDYLLDVIDKKVEDADYSDLALSEDEDGFSINDKDTRVKKQRIETPESPKKKLPHKQRTLTELLREKGLEDESSGDENDDHSSELDGEGLDDEASDDEGLDDEASDDGGSGEDLPEEEDSNEEEVISEKKKPKNRSNKPDVWEDIYGRLRDKDGNVIQKVEEKGKYIPPALRDISTSSEKKKEDLLRIQRKLKGLLNRLSESNIQPICSQIEDIFMKNSRNDVNESLLSLISDLTLSSTLTASRLIMEQAMLVALLHANVGSEVGAYFLQHLSKKFDHLLKSGQGYGIEKECNNLVTFLCHLYNFKVTGCILIFDILKIFINSFQEKDIELIQLVFKSVGFSLRKDNPLLLKEVIIKIQTKATAFKSQQNDSRINFMLETLIAIRNNNMYKITDYDRSIVDHAKKLLKGLIRKGSSAQELSISLEDLLNADEKGRWWIVGSAWADRDKPEAKTKDDADNPVLLQNPDASDKLLELAQKQHMNTDIRKTIFCIIMTAEDYMDAFEKLLKLNLKNQQEREINNVVLHCVLQEKSYNPYYAFLAEKFCSFSRKYMMSLQFSLWDKFKEMSSLNKHQVNNLSYFLIHLFNNLALPLSVLKVIQLSEMNKVMVVFFRKILSGILLHESEEVCIEVFKRISSAKNLNILREGLKIFMHHFLLRDQSKYSEETAEKLVQRVKVAESALNSVKKAFKL